MGYRILVIDDSPEYRVLVERMISKNCPECHVHLYDPVSQGRPDAGFSWEEFDIVLLDYDLGDEDGLVWLREFKKLPGLPPVLFLTGEGSERIAVKALKFGAEDYLSKRDVKADSLFDAIQEIVQESDIILNGSHSKKVFIGQLEKLLDNAEKNPASLLFVELDQAGAVREAGGLMGLEKVMRETEEIIYRLCGQVSDDCDWVRYADAVVLCVTPDIADELVLKDLGRKICEEINDSEYEFSGQKIKTTSSVGIVTIESHDDDLKTLLKKAEAASSAARIEGGNKSHIFPRRKTDQGDEKAEQADLTREITSGAARKEQEKADQKLQKRLDIADAIKTERLIMRYLPYVSVGSVSESQAEYFYQVLPFCLDKSGEEVDYRLVLEAASKSNEVIDLDLYISRLILTQSIRFSKTYNKHAGAFIDLASRAENRLEFFTRIASMADKVSNKRLGHPLIYKIPYHEFKRQSKEAVKAYVSLQSQAGVRFCVTGIDSVAAIVKALSFNLFSYVELGGDAAKGLFGNSEAHELVNDINDIISRSSSSLIVSGVSSAEQLMNALVYNPDLTCGEFISDILDNMIAADTVMTQIQL